MAVALLLASTWPHPGDRHSFAGTPGILEYGVMEWRSEGVVVRLRSASFRRRQGSGGTRRRDGSATAKQRKFHHRDTEFTEEEKGDGRRIRHEGIARRSRNQ